MSSSESESTSSPKGASTAAAGRNGVAMLAGIVGCAIWTCGRSISSRALGTDFLRGASPAWVKRTEKYFYRKCLVGFVWWSFLGILTLAMAKMATAKKMNLIMLISFESWLMLEESMTRIEWLFDSMGGPIYIDTSYEIRMNCLLKM